MDVDQLLDSVVRGSDSAADHLLEHHRDRLKRMVTMRMNRRLCARFDASDVVQEALIVAAKRLPDFAKQRPIPFYPWVRNLAWEQLVKMHEKHLKAAKRSVDREQHLRPTLTDDSINELANRLAQSQSSAPVDKLIRREIRNRARSAIETLPPTDREILELKFLEQLDNQEIAAILDISEGAVRVRNFRALKRIHRHLADETA